LKPINTKLFFVVIMLALAACKPSIDIPVPHSGEADFSRTIAIGGNYLTGYTNGALDCNSQKLSLPVLVASAFEKAGGSPVEPWIMDCNSSFGLHLKPWESQFTSASSLGTRTDCKEEVSLGPVRELLNASILSSVLNTRFYKENAFNYSVPFARTSDILNPSFSISFPSGNNNPYFGFFAKVPGVSTLLSDALEQKPSFFILWTGMEDIYEYARNGGSNSTIPSSEDFSQKLDSILTALTKDGAKGVVMNVPSIEHIPFYTLIPPRGLDLKQSTADSLNALTGLNFTVGENGFMIHDVFSQSGYRQLMANEYVLLTVPLDSIKCDYLGILDILPNRYVLDYSEIAIINKAVSQYNAVILQKTQQYKLAHTDINGFLRNVDKGIKWDGVNFNTSFVSGGFFSLDGYHPTQKGFALMANEVIKSVNERYKAQVPTVNCLECSGVLFP
jgi:hypothetical protein